MGEQLVMTFRLELCAGEYDRALDIAREYEATTGHVIDCREPVGNDVLEKGFRYLFQWSRSNRSSEAISDVFDMIERGGGVTLEGATVPERLGSGSFVNVMTMAARSCGSSLWVAPLLATPFLRPGWSVRDINSGLVPINEFLKHTLYGGCVRSDSERVALQMLSQTPIECLAPPMHPPPEKKGDRGADSPLAPHRTDSHDWSRVSSLDMALRLELGELVLDLMRRNVGDLLRFPDYVSAVIPANTFIDRKWRDLFDANRSYYTDLVPALQSCFAPFVPPPATFPKAILEIVAQFVRGPFQM
jgi:hypothetical protein